ncbi:hypothetical protein [Pseudonocardia sp. NPDC049635]|uniref:hypothetical protein n=1 Tax=Pseudonocardia sp. NPDC049635 TaxID=3155506 RepID=UPI0033F7763F
MPSDEMIGVDASGQVRPMRICGGLGVGCGKVDDHPRHVIELPGGAEALYHLDCHAAAGCASCAEQISGRPQSATGAELLDHLLAQAPAVPQAEDPAAVNIPVDTPED